MIDRSPIDETVRDIQDFADGFFAHHLTSRHIPGAAFVAVDQGSIGYMAGYGLSRLEPPRSVDPTSTVFRFGSLSKLVTAIAAMQLVEDGRLDLHRDVNSYLKRFQVPGTFPEPITPWHLLTHTEGFEARMFGIYASSADRLLPLGEFLRRSLPDRFVAPGRLITYGNFASAVLGALIEAVSGMPFGQYVEERVLVVAGMGDSTFRQPLPEQLLASRAGEYYFSRGRYRELAQSWPHMTPAGAMCGPIADLGRLLADLSSEDGRLLGAVTKSLMFDTQFRMAEQLPGVTLGWFEVLENGHRLLIRDGETEGFISRVVFDPQEKTGFAFAINARDKSLCRVLTSEFLDSFHPAPSTGSNRHMSVDPSIEGRYRFVQHTRHEFTRFVTLFTDVKVTNQTDTLLIEPRGEEPFCGLEEPDTYVEVAPNLYRGEESETYVAFIDEPDGTYLCSGSGYHGVRKRLRWHQAPWLQALALSTLVVSFIMLGIGSLVGGRGVDLLTLAINGLNLLTLILVAPATMLVGMDPGIPAFVKGWTPLMRGFFALPTFAMSATVALGVLMLMGNVTPLAILTMVFSVLHLTFLGSWNLLVPGRLGRLGSR